MKKTFLLSMLFPIAMMCSCQKQDSSAESQLAQRKTELDAREEAVVLREKAVEAREKAVAEKEKALADSRLIQPQRQAPDAAEAEAERQRRIQQLPPELKALIPDRSRIDGARAEKNATTEQQGLARTQRSFENSQKKKMFGAMGSSQPVVPQADATSPSPSPTPE
jgi:hypothetical protein